MNAIYPQSIDDAIGLMGKLFNHFENPASGDTDRFVSILISKPGLGKSATISKMCQKMGYELIDLNLACMEPTDMLGLGAREKVDGRWQTMPALPTWAQKALNGKCVIFVDEFNNGDGSQISAFQKMFSDFTIDGIPLPRTTHIIGACNPPGKDAIWAAKRLSGAFRRRLCMLPIKDDYSYVMKKHDFTMPSAYLDVDMESIAKYIEYDELNSAIVDNVFNIAGYDDFTDNEKMYLIAGFGSGAANFAEEMELLSDEAFSAMRKRVERKDLTYGEWKKDPDDVVSEYQQIVWGQHSIQNSYSYTRSRNFVAKVKNPNVYKSLRELLSEKFAVEWAGDAAQLPEDNSKLR